MHFVIHTDGGARGNPGPAAIGVVIEEREESSSINNLTSRDNSKEQSKNITSFGEVIGNTTNNVAEYTAVIKALEKLYIILLEKQKEGRVTFDFYLDSILVVNQIKGLFKIKEQHLKVLATKVHELEKKIDGIFHYYSIPREQNTKADLMVNQALDTAISS